MKIHENQLTDMYDISGTCVQRIRILVRFRFFSLKMQNACSKRSGYTNLEISVHVIEDETDVRPMTKNIQQLKTQ